MTERVTQVLQPNRAKWKVLFLSITTEPVERTVSSALTRPFFPYLQWTLKTA